MSAIVSALPTQGQDLDEWADMPPVMSPKTLSQFIEVSVATLTRWRGAKLGPAFFEPRGVNMVRYARSDVIAWLTENKKPGAVTPGQNTNL